MIHTLHLILLIAGALVVAWIAVAVVALVVMFLLRRWFIAKFKNSLHTLQSKEEHGR